MICHLKGAITHSLRNTLLNISATQHVTVGVKAYIIMLKKSFFPPHPRYNMTFSDSPTLQSQILGCEEHHLHVGDRLL